MEHVYLGLPRGGNAINMFFCLGSYLVVQVRFLPIMTARTGARRWKSCPKLKMVSVE